ncbi:hypothetical protein AVM02_02285 [Brucella anthropi]
MGDAYARSWVTAGDIKGNSVGMYRALCCRQFDFIKMRFTIWSGVDAQTLHQGFLSENELRTETITYPVGKVNYIILTQKAASDRANLDLAGSHSRVVNYRQV